MKNFGLLVISTSLLGTSLLEIGCSESKDPMMMPPPSETCPTPSGTGTEHGYLVEGTETWSAEGSPHRAPQSLSVRGTLTIAPCATVLVDGVIGVRGRLIAEGAADKVIHFDGIDGEKQWTGILIEYEEMGSVSLAHATISHAGIADDANVLGAIDARARSTSGPEARLKVDSVTIIGSESFGVVLRDGALFTADSKDLTISDSGSFPILADATLLGSIPPGTYTGNATDEILIDADRQVVVDMTVRDRGVPYRLGDEDGAAGRWLVVGVSGPDPIVATMTLEAGVKIRASEAASIRMAKHAAMDSAVGRLIVSGTAAKPVVFTSAAAAPAAGDWQGLVFDAPDPANHIDHARIEYAGGPSGANSFHCEPDGAFGEDEDAAIALYGEPASAFITNTEIAWSAGDGITRAWYGTPLDFLPTNTFTDVAECFQTYPRDINGACPAQTPCR